MSFMYRVANYRDISMIGANPIPHYKKIYVVVKYCADHTPMA
jgi:hypothetical protein